MMATTTGSEVIFDLDAPAFSSDDFRMFEFKVKRCPRVKPHDWACCPFSHANEKAKRRDPRLCKYSGTACPEFRRNGCCRRADSCPFAHGIFECWMHPSRYRTQMCSEVLECKRRVCFFAHTESELRRPVDDATWMQQHTVLEAAAAEAGGLFQDDSLASLKLQSKSQMLPSQQSVPAGGLIPAVPAAQNAGVWPLLQQLASSGQIDASQLLQLVQAMGPQQATPTASMTPGGLASAEGSTDLGQVAATLANLQAGASAFPPASITPDDASIAGSTGGATTASSLPAPGLTFAGTGGDLSGLSTATSGLTDTNAAALSGPTAQAEGSTALLGFPLKLDDEGKDPVSSVMALVQQLDMQLDNI